MLQQVTVGKHTGFDSLEIWAISKLTVILGGEWRCGTVAISCCDAQCPASRKIGALNNP